MTGTIPGADRGAFVALADGGTGESAGLGRLGGKAIPRPQGRCDGNLSAMVEDTDEPTDGGRRTTSTWW